MNQPIQDSNYREYNNIPTLLDTKEVLEQGINMLLVDLWQGRFDDQYPELTSIQQPGDLIIVLSPKVLTSENNNMRICFPFNIPATEKPYFCIVNAEILSNRLNQFNFLPFTLDIEISDTEPTS